MNADLPPLKKMRLDTEAELEKRRSEMSARQELEVKEIEQKLMDLKARHAAEMQNLLDKYCDVECIDVKLLFNGDINR